MNPATGETLRDLAADSPDAVAGKVEEARRAQAEWARTPLDQRRKAIAVFAGILEKNKDDLAARLTSEMGKPITQSRNELTALQSRLRFFLDNVEKALAEEVVHEKEAWREVITYEPLGLVGNISAWNYPYFVGSNVFVPALLTGNAVLYKPSEFATLTGLAITDAMHAAGVPAAVFAPVVGGIRPEMMRSRKSSPLPSRVRAASLTPSLPAVAPPPRCPARRCRHGRPG